ncbi:hypothetical protein CHU95_05340 [Niveispirillum lacus]|uniref:Glycosyltransferase subfamily 4-like N-terminal domain-containing protein n=1 Tax=Niveispirillum lacus TaxID=1981099 RepID=A0A255Z5Q0_9PROT|nr:hypothetical protein [Niveispirillum lacus]OYQ36215.1 hypothetical protein CHU95_05340 [Niveispirillum lacus]
MTKLVYLCDWLPPDFGAVGQYAVMHCRDRAALGYDVTLVGLTSGNQASLEEQVVGPGRVRTLRLPAPPLDRASLARRLAWTVRTNAMLIVRAWKYLSAADEILFTGSPPFLLHFLVPLNVVLRKKLIYRIADFHPECLIAARNRPSKLLDAALALTVWLRRRVQMFEASGEDQVRLLRHYGIPASNIVLKRDPPPVELTGDEVALPVPEELAGRKVLLYSGNWGVAHDTDTFITAYIRHHRTGSGTVGLWLNAVGAGADVVEERLRAEGLPVVRGRPVPFGDLGRLLVTPDAHLITLRDGFVAFVIPSKTYGCIASGKDVLYIGSPLSDVDLICRQGQRDGQRYIRADVGDAEAVFQALERLGSTAD